MKNRVKDLQAGYNGACMVYFFGLSSIFKLVSTPKIQILQGLYALRSNIVTIVVCYKERTLLSLDSPCYRVSDNHNDSSERPFLAQPTIGSFCSEFISL